MTARKNYKYKGASTASSYKVTSTASKRFRCKILIQSKFDAMEKSIEFNNKVAEDLKNTLSKEILLNNTHMFIIGELHL